MARELARRWPALAALAVVVLAAALLAGCPKDPLGPDNRMALMALGQCRHDQALLMTDGALARGTPDQRLRALLLRVAILRDRADLAAAAALAPAIDAVWVAVRRVQPTAERRDRDVQLFIDVARTERQARGLDPQCRPQPADDGPPVPAAGGPGPAAAGSGP